MSLTAKSLLEPVEKSSIRAMMQVKLLILALILVAIPSMCGRAKPDVAASFVATSARVDFNAQVRPILESRCTPCHFAGGTMYERLPFDHPETIKKLGTRLFTRIKDEKEQHIIREFLSQ